MAVLFTPGQQHESTVLEPLLEQGAVPRSGRGRPRIRPARLVGDKAYSSRKTRRYLRRRGIGYTIPRRRDERRTGPFNRSVYRLRNVVERFINRIKQFRRIATRYEKRVDNYRAMWLLGTIVLLL
jgi:transposase